MLKAGEIQEWADLMRQLEAHVRVWAYELEEARDSRADLARRTQAQTVGLRRLLDQMAIQGDR